MANSLIYKFCKKCSKNKKKLDFHRCKNRKDGLQTCCKECKLQQNKKWKRSNEEKIKKNNKEYRLNNLEEIKKKEKIRNSTKKRKEWTRKYNNERYKKDFIYRFSKNLKRRFRQILTLKQIPKSSKTFDILGYNPIDLFNHLKVFLDKPCEDCHSVTVDEKNSHIDHIKPIFLAESLEEIVEFNQLTNLRLICGRCNLLKGCKT